MVLVHSFDGHVAAGRGGRHHEGTGLYAVAHHGVLDGRELVYALDDDTARTGAVDAGAHQVQEVRQGNDLGLTGAVLDDGRSPGQDGGHHHVLGRGDARVLEVDLRAPETPWGRGLDKAVVQPYLRPQGPQTVEVEVEFPKTQVAPARRRDLGLPESGDQRPENHDASSHLAHEVVRGRVGVHAGGVDGERVAGELRLRTQPVEDCEHRLHVLYARDVVEHGASRSEERSSD